MHYFKRKLTSYNLTFYYLKSVFPHKVGKLLLNGSFFKLPNSNDKIIIFYYKDLFTHKDINTYINGVV